MIGKRKCFEKERSCSNYGEPIFLWKLLGVVGVLAAGCFALLSLCLKGKSDKYRDALIDLSDRLPAEEEDYGSREHWQRAHAPANRKTVKERLAEQRIQES